jgi:PDZ domain-containing protein
VDVLVKRASLLERLFPGIRDGSTLVPAGAVNPPGTNDAQRRTADLHEMALSQQIAAAVALKALGYKVISRPAGVLVTQVLGGSPAVGKLQPADVIVAVDGVRVPTPGTLRTQMRRHRPGSTVRLTVRSGDKLEHVAVKTVADPQDSTRAVIGFIPAQAATIKLPFPVRIDVNDVGGPSAGLAFALDLMEELGRDVDRGYRVAATGEIELDGRVDPIGGVKQKTIGAREAGVDVFLVPAGDNAQEARRYAGGLRIIPVNSFRQALRALATLPPKT